MTLNAASPSSLRRSLSAGSQVITIADVEEVIARMGKPEEHGAWCRREQRCRMRRLGRQQPCRQVVMVPAHGAAIPRRAVHAAVSTAIPNDKMLGGVVSGLAAYLGLGRDVAASGACLSS